MFYHLWLRWLSYSLLVTFASCTQASSSSIAVAPTPSSIAAPSWNALTLNNQDLAKIQQQDYQGAIVAFSTAIQLQLTLTEAYLGPGIAYSASRNYEEKLSSTPTLPLMAQVTKPAEQVTQQANQARQSEAKRYIGSLNRAEQAFFLENNYFTVDFYELGLPIKSETDANYRYRLFLLPRLRASKAGGSKPIWSIALPKKPNLKSYVGVAWVNPTARTDEFPLFAILCASNRPSRRLPSAPSFQNGKSGLVAKCPQGFSPLR